MTRRFQFTLERLMGTGSLFCVALTLALLAASPSAAAVIAFPLTLGAAIGMFFGRPLMGIKVVIAVANVLFCLAGCAAAWAILVHR